MALTTFRDLLAWLEANDLLQHVKRPVDPKHELMTVTRKMQMGANLGLLFDAPKGSPMPVATNVMSHRAAYAAVLGVKPEELLTTLRDREGATKPIQEVTDAPVHEVVLTKEQMDVSRHLPQVVHSARDGGAYVSAGIYLAKHPVTGVYNASWNRTQLVGGSHLRVRMMAPQHLGLYHQEAEKLGRGVPAACVIGGPPALMLAASSKIPFEADELLAAGGWQNEGLRMVKAKTQDLLVPADAEIVIEGEIIPFKMEDEGPFGEFMDSYVEIDKNHVFHATALTHRRDAVYHAILTATPEDLNLLGLMLQVEVLKSVSPHAEVVDVGTTGQIMGCVVCIRRKPDTDMAAVAKAAMEAHRWMKVVIIVDADVDPHNLTDVMWALHTRFTPDRDIHRIEGVEGFSRVKGTHVGKVALDATYPPHLEKGFRRRTFPGINELVLEDYLK